MVEFYISGSLLIFDVEDDHYRTDEMLVPWFVKNAFFNGESRTYADDTTLAVNPLTSLFFTCAACESHGCQEDGDEGHFIFLAIWGGRIFASGTKCAFWLSPASAHRHGWS